LIKKFKIFENINQGKPEVGDWCILTTFWAGAHLHNFINTTPAQIIKIESFGHLKRIVFVFDNTEVIFNFPRNWEKVVIVANYKDIIKCWSKNKEDLQQIIDAEKFGL